MNFMSHRLMTNCILPFVICHWSFAAEWPQYLGPERNGISIETGLLDRWPDGGPKEIWRVRGGVGTSGLSITGQRLVTMLRRDGKQTAVALNARTGEHLWQTPLAPKFDHWEYDGVLSTPTLHNGVAYCLTRDSTLAALDLETGRQIWQHNLREQFGGKRGGYGAACSPLVLGNLVIVTNSSPGATIVAYDKRTGELRWKVGIKDEWAAYCSPRWLKLHGRDQIVARLANSCVGLDLETQQVLWRYPFECSYSCNNAQPLLWKNKLFISSPANKGCVLMEFRQRPPGEVPAYDVSEAWMSLGPKSVMRNYVCTSILVDDHLFGIDVSNWGPVAHFNCVDTSTGQLIWRKARFDEGVGNLIYADGKLWIITQAGELVVLRASEKQYEEIGRTRVLHDKRTRQAPSLSNGRLYLRDFHEIVCLDVRGHESN